MPHKPFWIVPTIGCALVLSSCGASHIAQTAAPRAPQVDPTAPMSESDIAVEPSTPTAVARPTPDARSTRSAGDGLVSLTETETLVKADLAAVLAVPVEYIQVTEIITQTWPDRGLGCGATKGLFQSVPVPGYRIALSYGDESFRYHTDRQGNFVRCLEPGKPLGPIIKR